MKRLNQLQTKLDGNTIIIYDPTNIYYFTGYKIDPGLRCFLLIIEEGKEPFLLVNALFPTPSTINYIQYKDGEDIDKLLNKHITSNNTIYVDGTLPARFLLPLITMPITQPANFER